MIRKNLRLDDFDYSASGYYHITICTGNKGNVLGIVVCDKAGIASVALSSAGTAAKTGIEEIPQHYPMVQIVHYVIMPDHVHILLYLSNDQKDENRIFGRQVAAPTISVVIGQYKRFVSKNSGVSIWQKGYYDHIIRNEEDLKETIAYISNNPQKWALKYM